MQNQYISAKPTKIGIGLFCVLSLVMLIIKGHLQFDQYITHVQLWHKEDFRWTKYFYEKNQCWVWCHFIADLFWAFLLVWLVSKLMTTLIVAKKAGTYLGEWQEWLKKWFFNIAITGYLFDVLEFPFTIGALFYGWDPNWIVPINFCKIFFYMLGSVFLVTQFILFIILKGYLKDCRKFVEHNNLSIIVMVLVVFIIAKIKQGGTLIDHIIDHPVNVIALLVMINILVLMTWHFPYYHNLFSEAGNKKDNEFKFIRPGEMWAQKFDPQRVKAKSEPYKNFGSIWKIFRSITYFNVDVVTQRPAKAIWYHFQRIQASLIYVLAIFIVSAHLASSTSNADVFFKGGSYYLLPTLTLIGFIWFYVWFNKKYKQDQWWPVYKKFAAYSFYLGLGAFILYLSYHFYHSYVCPEVLGGYQQIIKLLLFCIMLILCGVIYIPTTIARLKISEKTKKDNVANWLVRWIGKWLGHDFNFSYLLSIGWTLSIVAFFAYNLTERSTEIYVNAINILLTWVILLFGFANLVTKVANITRRLKNNTNKKEKLFYRYQIVFAGSLTVLLILFLLTQMYDNRHHHLKPVKNKITDDLTLKNYLEDQVVATVSKDTTNQKSGRDESDSAKYIFITGDGGGLRAAYWNLLVMQQLDEATGYNLYNNTLVVSGISGGMVGQGVYFMLKNKYDEDFSFEKITAFANMNPLATDFSHLLGKRLLTYFMVFPKFTGYFEDSSRKMSFAYLREINALRTSYVDSCIYQSDELTMGFDEYWHDAYRNHSENFPLLIVNSAQSERSIKGIAAPFSIATDKSNPVFKMARSINEFMTDTIGTICFADALFTTNRFPVLSPAAAIVNKGHFLDGGYIDNSGLSTLIDLIDYLKTNVETREFYEKNLKGNIVLVSIQDGKPEYIYNHFWDRLDSLNHMAPSGEVQAIMRGASNLSLFAMPAYLDQRAKQLEQTKDIKYMKISLPFFLDRTSVQQLFSGQLKCRDLDRNVNSLNQKCKAAIYDYNKDLISSSDLKDTTLQYIINPPLSRALSPSVSHYMEAMSLKHKDVREAIDELKKYVSED